MRLLHTSDWHLGRALYGKKRLNEMEQFLDWLARVIDEREVGALLVAGDIFDNGTPSNQAQELYYRFLRRMARSSCHVVVTAGNHDSPTFLDAPSELLGLLDIHVRGRCGEDEVVTLRDERGNPELIVCAVPYLHDRDVRTVEAGEDFGSRQRALVEGVAAHYAATMDRARQVQAGLPIAVPIVLMGHLFIKGGKVIEDDGVRDLYVGTLVQLDTGIFPPDAAYVALGHLHVPQSVSETARYSGSPIPMGFGEASQQKFVCLVELRDAKAGAPAVIENIPIPNFQRLERLHGDWEAIESRLTELKFAGQPAWLEVRHEGKSAIADLRERLDRILEGCPFLEVLSARDEIRIRKTMEQFQGDAGLETLSPRDVFNRLLELRQVPEEEWEELRATYNEALHAVEAGGEEENAL